MPRTILNSRRSRTSCSVIALATVLAVGATPAAAQSFLGTGTYVTNPNATGITTTPGPAATTTINLNGGQTVIDWVPTDNATNPGVAINFQNAGTTATFTGSSDFSVLNRITPTDMSRVISMNGTINARVGGVQRGNVYFYSPNGFVFGGSSVFSVGSLVVTTSPIQLTGGNFISNPGTTNTVVFGQTPNPDAAIVSNGTIDANFIPFGVGSAGTSYVAMIAPRVEHNGAITVKGSAALVGAEAATMSFSPDGLFDIQVTVGTEDANGVTVTGDIGGVEATSSTDQRRVFLVAVPKNDALTMVISNGANLGFDLANNAAIDQYGAVVLSAGHDIVDGQIGSESAAAGAAANFWFTGAHATNNLFGEASGYADLYSTDAQASQLTTVFDSDVTVHANDHVWMNASGTGTMLTVGGDVNLSTNAGGAAGGNVTAGDTRLYALNGGTLTIGGDLSLTADAFGGNSESLGVAGGSATGGNVLLQASGGNITVGGSTYASASGQGGAGFSANGGAGNGGQVEITSSNGILALNGHLDAYARGEGGDAYASGTTSGNGTGGAITIRAQASGTIDIATGITGDARGRGGYTGFQVNGGDGTGGNIELLAQGGNATLDSGGAVFLFADGDAGSGGECLICGGIGGDGTGGIIAVGASNGTNNSLVIPSLLTMQANGYGGVGVDANAGTGTGGFVQLYAGDDSTVTISQSLTGSADGYGGDRLDGDSGSILDAIAGDGVGGFVEVFTFGTGNPDLNLLAGANIHANGYGGSTDVSGVASFGGSGTGGTAWIDAQAGTIDISGNALVKALGVGGDATFGTGGDGTGKNAEIDAIGGSISISGTALVDVSGEGGNGQTGGQGVGGGTVVEDAVFLDGAHIFARNGSITVGGSMIAQSSGTGGDGSSGGDGGDGAGGVARIFAQNSDLGPSSIIANGVESTTFVIAEGYGGNGGNGTNGSTGGNGGNGGDGSGGLALLTAAAGNGTLTVGNANLWAFGYGGDGGLGGTGSSGAGGNGGAGGDAFGGSVSFGTQSGNAQAAGSNLGVATFDSVSAFASAVGGRGGDGNSGTASGNGGDGGAATGGSATLLVRGSTVNVDNANLVASATGGDAGFGYVPNVGTPGTTGIGGNATVGGGGNGIHVTASGRFLIPAQRGTLNAGTITGSAIASSGIGIPDGNSVLLGGSSVTFLDADGNIGSLDFEVGIGGQNDSASGVDTISVINGAVGVDGTFSFTTDGNLSFLIDNGSLTASTLNLSAGNFVADLVNGPAANRGTAFANSASISTDGDFIADADFDIGDSLTIEAPGLIDAHNFTVDGNLRLVATGSILAGDLTATQHIGLATPSTITAGDVDAGLVFMALAHGDMIFGDATASEVFLSDYGFLNPGGLTATCEGNCGTLGANGVVTAPPSGPTYAYVSTFEGAPDTGQLSVGGTNGSVYTTSAFEVSAGTALDFFFNYVTSDGSSFADYAWAGLFTPSLDPVAVLYTARTQPSGTIVPGFGLPGVEATLDPAAVPIIGGAPAWSPLGDSSASCFAAGCGYTGWVTSSYEIADAGTYVLRFGVSNFSDMSFDSGMAFSGLSIGGVSLTPTLLTPTGGSITIGNVETGKFSAAAGTSLTTGIIDSSGAISLDAGGAITTGNLSAGDFVLANGGSITTGNIEASSVDMTSTGGNIMTLDINALGAVELNAFGDIVSGDITAGTIDLLAGDDITTGDLTTQILLLAAQEGSDPAMLIPGASITLQSGGDITTGDISSIDGVYADAGGSLSAGAIDAFDFVNLFAVNNISTGNITAGDQILVDAGASMTLGNLVTDLDVDLEAGGNATFGNANVGTEFDFDVGGNVAGGNIVAGVEIGGEGAGGNVVLGDLTAGFGEGELEDTFSIGFSAGGSITVGNVNGAQRVGFGALGGSLTTGNIQAGWDVLLLVDGNVVTGSITSGEGDQVFIADASMCTGCGSESGDDLDPEDVLALDPIATGGSITINGPVNTGLFRAAAGTGFTAQAIAAEDIQVSAGGTATVNGAWTASDVELSSNDIDITNGSIDASDILALFSTNATQALIGDGLAGSGYALSNAEFGRLEGGSVYVLARGDASAAQDMLIGDLTITGPGAGSTIDSPEGILAFGVGDFDGLDSEPNFGGVIRVNGDVAATGFGAGNAIEFHADRFELDAATGSVSIFSSGTTLGGELGLYADQIHVAAGSILNQLAINPTYTNYQQDLNEAADVPRPEGVIRADTLWIESDNLSSVLIQNTGTFDTRAGFLVRQAFINDDNEVAGPPGSINLVVNGQVVTEAGTLTGIDARDALVPEGTDITPFTSNSTINGCPLTGACIIAPPPPPPTANVVDSQIDLIGDSPFGEDDLEDTQEGDEGSNNPISPPQPLFDTRPLIPSGDVNDPVSGTGNPALLGSDQQCEEDENGQCPANPVKGDSQ